MRPSYFSPVTTALSQGINLIEASAGTGKTYAIAMLVLRFVVERELPIDQLLVVTFTKAATEELKDRIRQRLSDARRALARPADNVDSVVVHWLDTLEVEPELIRKRLDSALLNIDRAGIFTIHSFCQRILKEHALESGQLFDAELTGELAGVKQAITDDFWRRQIYTRPLWEISVLTAVYKTPDELLASVDGVPSGVHVYPEPDNLDTLLEELRRLSAQVRSGLEQTAAKLEEGIAQDKFKSEFAGKFENHIRLLSGWLEGNSPDAPPPEAFEMLTRGGLWEGLNGHKFRAGKTHSADQRKSDYLDGLAIDTLPFDALSRAFRRITIALRRALAADLQAELGKRLQQLNQLSFDDLIFRLSEALQGGNGGLLIRELRKRFKAVLIDEFQDTDTSQWFIFSTLFADASLYLYLIGDPKQAIYKFRGADIYAYLSAQEQAQFRFTLAQNWRSHPQLVHAVNQLFRRENAFLLGAVEFHEVQAAKSENEGALYRSGQQSAPMALWQLPEDASKSGHWTAGKAAQEVCRAVINETVDLMNEDCVLMPEGRKLQPRDIAILVRTNTQAREYQAALRTAGIPAVINSTESVFLTQEAADLYCLLRAVAHPGDQSLLKQALALNWFALDGLALYRLSNDEALLDAWVSRFAGYFLAWQQKGLMAMMLQLLTHERVRPNLSASAAAERQLANIHHLLELIQQAAVENHLGIDKTLDWLRSAITRAGEGGGGSEGQQLRLESDDDAVQVITMHRAKGLEYPVVFCPCLWQRSGRLSRENLVIKCHEQGRMVADLGSDRFESRRARALEEELAEDIRIAYVALTRAKYRCYLVWADVRTANAPNASALAWLLDFADAGFSGQQAKLQSLHAQSPNAFDYVLMDVNEDTCGVYRKDGVSDILRARKRHRSLFTHWQMSSYTALSALSLHEAPELPPDKAGEFQPPSEHPAALLPRGAQTGNVVHELLEKQPFAGLAHRKDIAAQRDQACRRYGLKLERPEILDELLQAVVRTPLSGTDPDFCLMNLEERRCLKEMPFYLSMKTMDASQLNRVLQPSPVFQPLTGKSMCGYLTGFIDLICEFRGRFYVMDYKTNDLADYSSQSLTEAMREHNYGLQYFLYTLVLHRYLQYRLPDYRYETHFGGVCYLFVRGMQPERPMSGVYRDRPELERIQALAGLFAS